MTQSLWRRPKLRLIARSSATSALAARAKRLQETTPSLPLSAAMAAVFADPDNRDLVIQAQYESY
jgi:hypothetical protein